MTLLVDASTPAIKGLSGIATSVVSNSFSPPAGSVLIIPVSIDGVGSAVTTVTSLTDSLGSHLAYAQRVTVASSNVRSDVWWAFCPSAQVGMTITANIGATQKAAISVIVFTGADPVQNGAVGSAQSASGTPSASLTTTRAGSWVLGMVTDFSSDHTPTIPGGQTEVFNGNTLQFSYAVGGEGCWTQGLSAASGAPGPVTINDTAPTGIDYAEAIAEVLAAATTLPPRVVVVDTAVARSTNY